MARFTEFAVGACLLVGMTVGAYWPATQCGYIWDDDHHVLNNQALRSAAGLQRIWFQSGPVPAAFPVSSQYYPIVYTSFWIEYQIWNTDPTGYHVVNILLHALGAVLLWSVLRFLQVPAAWFAAAIFAVHPVHVESVAWMSERKNVLSGVFYFGAAFMYLRYAVGWAVPTDGMRHSVGIAHPTPKPSRWLFYAISLTLFLCALLSKSVTCSLPAALLLVLWWKRRRVVFADVLALTPFFALGLALGLLTVWMERHRVGAAGDEWHLTLIDRCLIAGRAVWFYASKLFWPARLTFIYPRWQIDAHLWWQYLYPLFAVVLVFGLWLTRARIGRATLVGALFFGGTLIPALGFFDVYPMRYSFVADHFQYLASLGLIVPVTAMTCQVADRLGHRTKTFATMLGVLLLATLGTLTWRQCPAYADVETLWQDTIDKNPDAWIAHNNLANALESNQQDVKAIEHYREAIRRKPDLVEAHYNLANALKRQGDLTQCVFHFREAIRFRPNDIKLHNNLGIALVLQGDLESAIQRFRQALRINRDSFGAHYNLAKTLIRYDKPDEAIRHARRAAELTNRQNAAVLEVLGRAYEGAGRHREATIILQQAKELRVGPNPN